MPLWAVPREGACEIRPRLIWGAGATTLLPDIVTTVKRGRFAWIDGGHYLTSTCHVANVTRTAVALAGGEVSVIDEKARRELGYRAAVSREAGLAAMRAASHGAHGPAR